MTPDEYCKERAAHSGSSFYYSFLFLDPQRRRAITALYAFCREVDDIVDECSDTNVARAKLEWWRTEIRRLYASRPEHPVSRSLAPLLDRFDLVEEHFLEIIDGMEMDLDQARYDTFRALTLYCHRVAGVVGLMAAEIFGYGNRQTQKYAHTLGLAFQLTNILRDVREDAVRGRIYIPAEELQRFGVDGRQLSQSATPDNVRELFAFQAQRAHEYYDRALRLLPDEDRYAQRSGLIMAAVYAATLREIERDGYRLLEHRISLTPVRKLWLAWLTVFQENRRHARYSRRAA